MKGIEEALKVEPAEEEKVRGVFCLRGSGAITFHSSTPQKTREIDLGPGCRFNTPDNKTSTHAYLVSFLGLYIFRFSLVIISSLGTLVQTET